LSLPIIGITSMNRPPSGDGPLGDVGTTFLPETYVQAVATAGGTPLIVPTHLDQAGLAAIFERLDGLLLSGGGDIAPHFYKASDSGFNKFVDEQRDQAELTLAHWAVERRLPYLGICRGMQLLNVAYGGTLYQDLPRQRPDSLAHEPQEGQPREQVLHTVRLEAESHLASLLRGPELEVNTYHHQGVQQLAAGLQASAHAPDGLIEGLEDPEHPFGLAVQWHPERRPARPETQALFQALIEACAGRRHA
jgi:putative glutamine amidotransferase